MMTKKVWLTTLFGGVLVVGMVTFLRANSQEPEQRDEPFMNFFFQGGAQLGVQVREVRSDDVSRLKLPAERGAVIDKVLPNTPASEAGLQEQDVVVEFDGEMIHSAAQLRRLIRETPAGRGVNLTVVRGGQRKSVSVKLREDSRHVFAGTPGREFRFEPRIELNGMPNIINSMVRPPARLGVQVQNLTEQLAEFLKVPGKTGVLVAGVTENSAAQKAGLRAGDVIVSVNGKAVNETQDLQEALRRDVTSAQIEFYRNGQKQSAQVNLEPPRARQRGEGIRM
ncbi:MAG TPA: PDZ domain-containing protein [Acidobacteriota bacterium]|jgi:S1-C subfamily serine protease